MPDINMTMKPSNFFKKISEKINEMSSEDKKNIFSKNNIEFLKQISNCCSLEEKFITVSSKNKIEEISKFISYFNLSVYYSRRGWDIFLTNFKSYKFSKIQDDRYRFLEKLYPKCNELKELRKKRNKFFQEVMK